MAKIDAGPCTNPGSDSARPEIILMTPPIPTEVMMLASFRNSSALLTGNLYLQDSNVGFLKCFRIASAV